jgi:hypothetical protein
MSRIVIVIDYRRFNKNYEHFLGAWLEINFLRSVPCTWMCRWNRKLVIGEREDECLCMTGPISPAVLHVSMLDLYFPQLHLFRPTHRETNLQLIRFKLEVLLS